MYVYITRFRLGTIFAQASKLFELFVDEQLGLSDGSSDSAADGVGNPFATQILLRLGAERD